MFPLQESLDLLLITICNRALIIRIINDVLYDCNILEDDTYRALWVPAQILFYGFAWLTWLAIYMFPLTLAMLQQARIPIRVAVIIQSLSFGLICVMWIGMTIESQLYSWSTTYTYHEGTAYKSYMGLLATYTTLYFVATLATSGLLIFAMVKLNHNPVLSQVCQCG